MADRCSPKILLAPTSSPEPRLLGGFDLLLDGWSDYIVKYSYVVDDDRLRRALAAAVDRYPYMAGRKVAVDNAISVQQFSGMLYQTCWRDQDYPRQLDLLDGNGHGFLHDNSLRVRHLISSTNLKTPLLQVKHTLCPNGSVLGISVWHSLADVANVFSFFEAVTRLYRGLPLPPVQSIASRPAAAADGTPGDETILADAVVAVPASSRRDFAVKFLFKEFPLDAAQRQALEHLGGTIGCKWTDCLFALAWQVLARSMDRHPEQVLELCLLVSVDGIGSAPGGCGNQLVYPRLKLARDRFEQCSHAEIARLIQSANSLGVLKELRRLGALRASINCLVTRESRLQYAIAPLYEAIFGSGVMCNNFCGVQKEAFNFGGGHPDWIDFPLDEHIRFLALSPFGPGQDGHTFSIAAFEPEMQRFVAEFPARLDEITRAADARQGV